MPNPIVVENAKPGTDRSVWDLPAGNFGGSPIIQGFVDGFSVDRTETVRFRIAEVGGRGWKMKIYRLGWYQGKGARLLSTIQPTAEQMILARKQPAPADCDQGRGSADCSAWKMILTWRVPVDVPSGVFVAKLILTDGSASHILFVVRDDSRRPSIRVQLADPTWQAYNAFGGLGDRLYAGNSLYHGTDVNQYDNNSARVVSYDRPIVNRGAVDRSYGAVQWSTFFTGEYPMVRWLERTGYDVAYMAGLDAAGSLPLNAPVAMMVGHNEYWSQQMKDVWLAHLAGGNHAFICSSNEAFWRTVGERQDGRRRPRLMRCHKDNIPGRQSPPGEWTGTWRTIGQPENDWTGTIFAINGPFFAPLVVPNTTHPIWRNTDISPGWTSPPQILGFEIDTYGPQGTSSAEAGRFMATPGPAVEFASDTLLDIPNGALLIDAGQEYGGPGQVRHRLVWVNRSNGGKTFATGSMCWALGLDEANTLNRVGNDNTSTVIRQATMNVLTDMGVQV